MSKRHEQRAPVSHVFGGGPEPKRGRATRAATGTLLGLSGLVLFVIGGGVLLAPHAFYASNGIALGSDPSQLSEVRAPAGLLLLAGFMGVLGAFRRRLRGPALASTAAVYGSYGLSRLLGAAVDGLPGEGLVMAMAFELAVGALAAVTLLRLRVDTA
ncbi:MAG: DUF4345 domain-containing protein [Myxococcota bacterium]